MFSETISPKSVVSYVLSKFTRHAVREVNILIPPGIPLAAIDEAFQKFQATLSPDMKYSLNGRLERGLLIARTGGVGFYTDPIHPNGGRLYKVNSSDLLKPPYLVDLQGRSCTCPDHWKGHFCKHRIAAQIIDMAKQIADNSKVQPVTLPPVSPQPVVTPPVLVPQPSKEPPVQQPISTAVEQTPSAIKPPSKEPIIWGAIRLQGQILGVEVISIEEETVRVRALPKIIEGKKLQPQFPFEGKHCTASVAKKELFHVKIFQ